MTMLHVCALSHIGKVRTENQDAFLINGMVDQEFIELKLSEQGLIFNRYGLLCAVADGMGGHRGGGIASKQALDLLSLEFHRLAKLEDVQRASQYIDHCILNIHRQLLGRGTKESELSGMGTTLLGVYLHPGFACAFHAGDSRLYRFRSGTLMQLTSDHRPEVTLVTNYGRLSSDVKSGIITNCVGCNANSCKPELSKVSFHRNDTLMLCSDGLSDMLELEFMEAILNQEQNLPESTRKMVAEANKAGGFDNITLVLIKKEDDYYG